VLEHSRRRAIGPWRHRAFLVWTVATSAITLYLAVAAPFAEYFHEDLRLVAMVVPPISFLLLAVGIWWLVWLVTAAPRRGEGDDRERRAMGGTSSTPQG
jgi:hypothetical protein